MALDIKDEVQKAKDIIERIDHCILVSNITWSCTDCPYFFSDDSCFRVFMLSARDSLKFFLKLQDPMGLNKEEHHDNT